MFGVRPSINVTPEATPADHLDARRIVGVLEAAGYQATGTRRLVAELIASSNGHFTAADLLARGRGRDPSLGRATVFRALDLLASLHVVERLDLPTGAHAYVLCEPELHHHHLVCSACGRSVDVADGELVRLVDEIAEREGFRIEAHRLELFGTCGSCCVAETKASKSPKASMGGAG